MAGAPTITIVHLSDVQFSAGTPDLAERASIAPPTSAPDGPPRSTLEDELLGDLELLREQHGLCPDLVVISGDLTAQALPAEFTRARDFAAALAGGLRLGPDRVMIVPGNHDVSWTGSKAYVYGCRSRGETPKPPYRPKWRSYAEMLQAFYAGVADGPAFRGPVDEQARPAFPMDEPWTLLQIPQLRTVVAGLNSTMAETHQVHRGHLGEQQIRWFDLRLRPYAKLGWLRIGVLHHNPERTGADDESATDTALFQQRLADKLNLVLHGHTSEAGLCRLGADSVPVLSAGRTRDGARAGAGQYQIVQVSHGKVRVMARRYHPARRRWIGDTRISLHGNDWRRDLNVRLRDAGAALPESASASLPEPAAIEKAAEEAAKHAVASATPGTPAEAAAATTAPVADTIATVAPVANTVATVAPVAGTVAMAGRTPLDDLLRQVEEICRLRSGGTATTSQVTLEPPEAAAAGARVPEPPLRYLRVVDRAGGAARTYPVGVCGHTVAADDLERFVARVDRPYRENDPHLVSILVYTGDPVPHDLRRTALRRGVRLERFLDYQDVHDLSGYAARQASELSADQARYPEWLYVPQRYTLVGEPGSGGRTRTHQDLLGQIVGWLAEPDRRFVLVLGDSGTGKSFLLRQLARSMRRDLPRVVPLPMDLRSLDRTEGLDELVASHLAASGETRTDLRQLRYLRREGRVALLFDGFDELEQRITYDRAAEHLERLLRMVEGRAKVVLTCRTQHFLNDAQATRPIADRLDVGVRRIARLAELSDAQIRQFHDQLLQRPTARPISDAIRARVTARLDLIRRVPSLAGLARNPRMLGFIIHLDEERLRAVDSPAALYRELLVRWLGYEYGRAHPPGRKRSLTLTQRWDAVTRLALRLCQSSERTLGESDLREVAGALTNLATVQLDADTATQVIGSGTLLTRTSDARFGFVHQSMAEWLVARQAARDVDAARSGRRGGGTLAGEGDRVLRLTRLSDLAVKFLCELADPTALGSWIAAVIADPASGDAAQANALAIRGQLELVVPSAVTRRRSPQTKAGSPQTKAGSPQTKAGSPQTTAGSPQTTARSRRRVPEAVAGPAVLRLAGQNLRGRRFAGENLRHADFSRADLTEADLTGAQLDGALLREANLTRARLDDARLVTADLTGADLTGCRLLGADLTGARLDKVRWDRTALIGATLDPTTLRQARQALARTGSALPDGADVTVRAGALAVSGVTTVAVAPSDGQLIAGATDGTVRVWDTATGRLTGTVSVGCGEVRAITAGRHGEPHATTAPHDKPHATTADPHGEPRATIAGRGRGRDTWLAVGGAGGPVVKIGDLTTRRMARTLAGHTAWVQSAAAAPDGSWLATASADGTVRLWDATTGQQRRSLTGHAGGVWAVAIAANGQWLASGGADGTVRLWDATTGQQRRSLTGHAGGVWAVAIAANGQWLASGGADGTVRVWDATTGRERHAIGGHGDSVFALAAGQHAGGSWLAAGGDDGAIRLWEPETGRSLCVLTAHSRAVSSLAAAHDGTWLASGGADGTVRLWDVTTGRGRAVLVPLTAGGWAVLLPDLRYKLEGTPNGEFWYAAGQCSFEPGELDPYLPAAQRLTPDVPLGPPPPSGAGRPSQRPRGRRASHPTTQP